MKNLISKTNIFSIKPILLCVFEGNWENFKTILLPLSIKAKKKYNLNTVIITSNLLEIIYKDIKDYKFIYVDDINFVPDEMMPYDLPKIPFSKSKNLIYRSFNRFIFEFNKVVFFKKRANKILNLYKPIAIFLHKGNFAEVPFIVQKSKKLNIPTIAFQTNNGCFSNIWKIMEENYQKNHLRSMPFIKRSIMYIYYKLIFRKFQNFVYRLLGLYVSLEHIRNKGDVTFYAVESNRILDMYKENGYYKNNMIVTGAPEDDILFDLKKSYENRNKYFDDRKKFGIKPNEFLIVFCLSNGPAIWLGSQDVDNKENHENEISKILSVLTLNNNKVIVKVHPKDDIKNYSFLKKIFKNIEIVQYCDSHCLIAISNLVITDGSTTSRWPRLINIPVYIWSSDYNILSNNTSVVYDVPTINSLSELKQKIKLVKVNNIKRSNNDLADGKAIKRILDLIEFKFSK